MTGKCANKFTSLSPDKTNHTPELNVQSTNLHSLIAPNPMKLCLFLLPAFVALTLGNALPNTNSRLFFRSLNQEPPPPPSDPTRDNSRFLRQGIIQQKLDHFDDSNDTLWQMRFLANSAFYQPGGPIFIMVGGEWEISAGWIQGGHMYDMAQQMSGHLFYTEHRFYGYSRPTR